MVKENKKDWEDQWRRNKGKIRDGKHMGENGRKWEKMEKHGKML